jgi:carbonic anhydrase/acetyltransferase-like protein (isoleucine patch superfamily)
VKRAAIEQGIVMDIRGLILIDNDQAREDHELFSTPAGLVDVAGKNAMIRTAERLQQAGIRPITSVVASEVPATRVREISVPDLKQTTAAPERFWRAAESAFNELVQEGAELVILIKIGAYVEADFERLIQFHLDQECRVTQLSYLGEPLQIFCLSASRRNDAASLLRSNLTKCRSECPMLEHFGYVNFLGNGGDVRQFAIDILMRQTETAPAGKERKPGVWVGSGAQIERGARLLAPAYIGCMARICSGAVITRCSTVEHHGHVDLGTVIENSSVLAYSYVGAGLDLAHSVTGQARIANLRRGATAEVPDRKLVAALAESSARKLFSSAAEFVSYLPRQVWRGMWGDKTRVPDLQATLHQTSPALGNAAGYEAPACNTEAANDFHTPTLAVARPHGNQ